MKQILLISIWLTLFSVIGFAQTEKIESIYTDFGDKNCKELKNDAEDGILYRGECPGVGGYKLIFYESEHHQTLGLVAPDGKEFDLNLVISAAPSYLGQKAEWRVRKQGKNKIPSALIVRMNVLDDPDDREKAKSFLLVIKITNDATCVTDKIEPSVRNQNTKARQLADVAAEKPCRE
jgi:hypothetical protein